MSGTQESTERPPVRARSGRRPIPPLVFLLVLALVALGVWWNVLRADAERRATEEAACESAAEAPPSLDPTTIAVRVLNATDTAGEAQRVAQQLQQRGFIIDEIGNDGTDRDVTGVGEVRHGRPGRDTARYLSLYAPGATTYEDTRATGLVDLVIGPEFTDLAAAEEIEAALVPPEDLPSTC
jgi:LytR cell envelope-related transcriptional attenuator